MAVVMAILSYSRTFENVHVLPCLWPTQMRPTTIIVYNIAGGHFVFVSILQYDLLQLFHSSSHGMSYPISGLGKTFIPESGYNPNKPLVVRYSVIL